MEKESVIKHLSDFRKTLIRSMVIFILAFVISFVVYPKFLKYIINYFKNVFPIYASDLYVMKITEGFLTRMHVSLYLALIISLPFIFFTISLFILPALKKSEKRILFFSVFFFFFLAAFGGAFAYIKIAPFTISFLTSNRFVSEDLTLLLNYKESILYLFHFVLISAFTFTLPLILLLFLIFKILSRKKVFSLSRYIIIVIFVFSAIITPPDIISQLAIALPLSFLFFISLAIAKLFNLGAE